MKTLGDRGNDVHMQESLMKEGKIFVDRDWSLVMLCQLDFTNYPFDSHVCPFQIISQYDGVETIQTKSTFRAGNNEGIGECSISCPSSFFNGAVYYSRNSPIRG